MTDTPNETDEAGIRAVIEERAAALRAKDAPGVVAHHAPDFVHFSLAPPLVATYTDATGLEAWFATWRGRLGYEVRDLEIAVGGDTAFAFGLARLSGTKTDGATNEVWFRQTLGLRRIGGAWKIVHEHESVPFYMDGSYRAAVDLAP